MNNLPNVAPGDIAGNIVIMHYEDNGRHYYKVKGSVDVSLNQIVARQRSRGGNQRQLEPVWTGQTNYDVNRAEERIKLGLQGVGLRRDEKRLDWLWTEEPAMDVDNVKVFAEEALQAYHESI